MWTQATSTSGRSNRTGVLAGAGVALAALLLAVPAFACTAGAEISADTAKGPPGSTIIITGELFEVSTVPVSLRWGGASGPELAAATPDVNGDFTQTVTIPADAKDGFTAITAVQKQDSAAGFWVSNLAFEVDAPVTDEPAPAPVGEGSQDDPADAPAPQPEPEPVGSTDDQPADGTQDQADAPAPAPAAKDTPKAQPAAPAPKAAPPAPATDEPAPAPAANRPAARTADTAPAADEVPAAATTARPTVQVPSHALGNGVIDLQRLRQASIPKAQAPDPAIVLPDTTGANATLGAPPEVPVGPSPWLLVPLSVVGAGLFSFGAATGVRELRSRRPALSSTGSKGSDRT